MVIIFLYMNIRDKKASCRAALINAQPIVHYELGEGLDVLDVVFEGVLADSACFES